MEDILGNRFNWVKDVPQWGTFIGTFMVSFLAMFSNSLKRLLCKPKLRYAINNTRKFCGLIGDDPDETSDATRKTMDFSWHLQVTNAGKNVATNCQIRCDRIYQEQDSGGKFSLKKEFVSKSFCWETGEKKDDVFPGRPSWCKIFMLSELDKQGKNAEGAKDVDVVSKPCLHLYLAVERNIPGQYISLRSKKINTFLIPLSVHYEGVGSADTIWIYVHWTDGDSAPSEDNLIVEIKNEKEVKKLLKEMP